MTAPKEPGSRNFGALVRLIAELLVLTQVTCADKCAKLSADYGALVRALLNKTVMCVPGTHEGNLPPVCRPRA